MAHHTLKSGYTELVERLNRFPQGAPPSESLYKILAMLFSEREAAAGLAAADQAVHRRARPRASWKLDVAEARRVLDELAGRAILVDMERGRRDDLHPAAADGRLLRVLDDARCAATSTRRCWASCSTST